jgi:quercetin dioxygenase-like cupin family protein
MRKFLLITLPVLLAGSAAQADVSSSAAVKWGPAPPSLPKGAQAAVLSGDPTKEGMFTVRFRFPAGFRVMPHHHPTDELLTVISGQLSRGMGDRFGRGKIVNMAAGGYAVMPAGMNHYAFTRAGATIQITARGPFQVIYANPKDDPRTK